MKVYTGKLWANNALRQYFWDSRDRVRPPAPEVDTALDLSHNIQPCIPLLLTTTEDPSDEALARQLLL